ncbi:hypothetical protein ACN42_g11668, partial [Penicillium freii]
MRSILAGLDFFNMHVFFFGGGSKKKK